MARPPLFSLPDAPTDGLAAARRSLLRWGRAPEKLALRERELSELTRELDSLLRLSASDPAALPLRSFSDPVLARVLRREELGAGIRDRLEEIRRELSREYDFCREVDRALATLPPDAERLLRLIYRDRATMAGIASVFCFSRAQLYRLRRKAELALAPLLPDAA